MDELRNIARSRSESDMSSRLLSLPKDVQALQRSLSAKGQLMSGNMLRAVLVIAQESIRALAGALTAHYSWAVEQALTASQSWVRGLASEAADSMQPLLRAGSEQVTAACQLAKQPQLAARLIADLESVHLEARQSILVALDSVYASKSRGVLRKLGALLGRLLPGSMGK